VVADQVALIGVGNMGQGLLARLIQAGVKVRAFDILESQMEKAREAGAETCASAAEAAAGMPIIHVIVRTDDQVIEATIGPGGVLEGANEGARLILHSTILPDVTRRVAEAAAQKGAVVIDSPVTAVPRRVHAGEATFLVGGPDDVVAELRPHLESLGKAVVHFGPLTSGNVAKISKNLTNAIERVMISEATRLAAAGGIDAGQFLEMAKSISSGATVANWERCFDIDDGQAVHKQEPESILFDKDIHHAAALAKSLGLDLPVTQGTAKTVTEWQRIWEE
jgi:3-hydroxyisobutyrate dehydrogenase-like beta-hydroxyacid dehydrogenase